jgi:Secretion system C-terminal sorting domain
MNLKSLSFLLLSFIVKVSFSQASYTISPSTTINLTVDFYQATSSKIYQVNTAGSKILLKWESILVSIPIGWSYTSCDYGACYGGIPSGPNSMDSIPIGGQGVVGLDIEPENILGTGVVKILVYQDGYRSSGDTLTWIITSQPIGIKEMTEVSGVSIYPNPTNQFLHIEFSTLFKQTAKQIYFIDALGKKIKTIDFQDQQSTVDVSDLSNGYYNLVIETENEKLFKKIVKSD